MAEIEKCSNRTCPINRACYRHTSPHGHKQKWVLFEWFTINGNHFGCDSFISNRNKKNKVN